MGKLAVEEPDSRGMEWMLFPDWYSTWQMPLPRTLAHIKWEVSEEKWAEAQRWAGGRVARQKIQAADLAAAGWNCGR